MGHTLLLAALVTMTSAQPVQILPQCQPYADVITICGTFGQALLRQMKNTPFNLTDLSPSLVCGSPCFNTSNYATIKYALAAGCFGPMDREAGFNIAEIDAYFDSVEDFVCAKNPLANVYCGAYLESNLSEPCNALDNAGCCLGNFIISNFQLRELYPGAPSALEMYTAAAECNTSIPTGQCPGSGNLQAGISTMSLVCQANPLMQTCQAFGTAFYMEVLRHKLYNTTLPNSTSICDDPCFTPENMFFIKALIEDGCFDQIALDLGPATTSSGLPSNISIGDMVAHAIAFFNVVESFSCARNPVADQYCSTYLVEAEIGASCSTVMNAGCCVANFERIRDSFQILDTSYTQAGLGNLLDICGLQVPANVCPGTVFTDFGSFDNPVVPTDIPLVANPQCHLYTSIVAECFAIGSHISNFLTSNANNTLSPQVICNDQCFTRSKLNLVRIALQLGCFAPGVMQENHHNITDALESLRFADNLFDYIEDFVCTKNGDTYCVTYLDEGINSSSPCSAMSEAGCCLETFVHCDSHIRAIHPGYPTGLQMLEFADNCSVPWPDNTCEGSVRVNVGGGGLSAVCQSNPIMHDCEDFYEALVQQFIVLHRTNISLFGDFGPNYLCNSVCFTSTNIDYLKQALKDGCFEQFNNEAEFTDDTGLLQAQAEAYADAVEDFACARTSEGLFCAGFLQQQVTNTNYSLHHVCTEVATAGCCVKSIENSANEISVLFPQFPNSATMTENMNNLAEGCAIILPPACAAPMTSYISHTESFTSSLSFWDDAGISIGILAVAALIVVVGCYAMKGKKSKPEYSSMQANDAYAGAV